MPNGKDYPSYPQTKQPPLMRRFVMFSVTLFIVILVSGGIAFMFSMRQIIRANKAVELSRLLEVERLKLETYVFNEISHALMTAESPLIKSFFADPSNPELKKMGLEEIAAYRRAFTSGTIFWVTVADKQFYFNDDDPYILDPDLPDNYWYYMTLYETAGYNFNINYNPDLNVTNLWINVPVFDDAGKPLGMLGTGIEISAFLDTIYKDRSKDDNLFFFNTLGEITGAFDVHLVAEKRDISEELNYLGMDILSAAEKLEPGESQSLEFEHGRIAINSIPLLEWYSIAAYSYSINDYDSSMTALFVLTLIMLAAVLVIFNVFISRLIEPLRKSIVEAEAANRAKSDFLSTMSHEIRTPLNAILGITEIQLQSSSLDRDVRDGLEKVYASGDMLLGIINDILDLSKIEAGRFELVPDRYEMASLISDTAQLNVLRLGNKAIEFDLFVDKDTPAYLYGDELRVKQILNNLLSNAFKYTERGTVKMSVSSYASKSAAEGDVVLVVSVSDTGQGMTKEQVDKLFDKYARFNMDANRTTEGTGLGMNITRTLVQKMDGKIDIESRPGEGSVFTVYLPHISVSDDVIGEEGAESLHNFRSSNIAQMKRVQLIYDPMPFGRVLIVDDVETNIYVARGLLAPYEINVDSVDSGFGAIEKIKRGESYDIIFMDHMMPRMDGVEATKIIRDMGYTLPIIALTANAVSGQAEIFLLNGFDDFISKPIDIRRLDVILTKLIRDKRPRETDGEEKRQQAPEYLKPSPAAGEKDPALTEIVLRDANKSIAALDMLMEKGAASFGEDDLRSYIIHTHGMKSALANFGNHELSSMASELEGYGRSDDIKAISEHTPAFLAALKAFALELAPKAAPAVSAAISPDVRYLTDALEKIKAACSEYDENGADDILSELRGKEWPREIGALLGDLAELLLHSDFDEVTRLIDAFIAGR